jgi:hypothetical protein
MGEIVFNEELRGTGGPAEGLEKTLEVQASGSGPQGEEVTFESKVVLSSDGFNEWGTISYAGRGSLKFDTIGMGHIGPSQVPDLNHGSVIWRVTGGDGEFAGATGLITSNFTFSKQGKVVDNQWVRLFIP